MASELESVAHRLGVLAYLTGPAMDDIDEEQREFLGLMLEELLTGEAEVLRTLHGALRHPRPAVATGGPARARRWISSTLAPACISSRAI